MNMIERVADRAAGYRVATLVLTPVAGLLWLVGALLGLVWLALSWSIAAVVVGASDARGLGRAPVEHGDG